MKHKLIAIACLILLALPVRVDAIVIGAKLHGGISIPKDNNNKYQSQEVILTQEQQKVANTVAGILILSMVTGIGIVCCTKPY